MTVTNNAGETRTVDIDPGRDTAPLVVGERTLLPARALVEAMGGQIDYEGDSAVTIASGGRTVRLEAGEKTLLVDGAAVELDVAPCFHGERTYLPVRGLTEALDCRVDWDPGTETVTVTTAHADAHAGTGRLPLVPHPGGADRGKADLHPPAGPLRHRKRLLRGGRHGGEPDLLHR